MSTHDVDPARAFLAQLEQQHRRGHQQPTRRMRMMRLGSGNGEVAAAYDAAGYSEWTARHWRNADALSADSANSPDVRATLRSRARYECLENNSILKGIVHTLATDVIGRGPRLQLAFEDRALNERLERHWHRWAAQVQLGRKLRTARVAKCVDGEAFLLLITNRRGMTVDQGLQRIQLDVVGIEADQVASATPQYDDRSIDGVEFDEWGNPTYYHVLKAHPGDEAAAPYTHDRIPASQVIHLYRQDRPGQHRGIPEVTPALPLIALLRDYTLAVVQSARTAAKITAVLETQANTTAMGDEAYDPEIEPFDAVDIDYDAIVSMPFGWRVNQFKAEQPTTTYAMFKAEIINEISRCLCMPYNVAAGNSSSYNYSSGRLDHQTYHAAIAVERSEWELLCLDRILSAWFDEAVLAGLIPPGIGPVDEIPHRWHWDGRGHVDPQKEATAQQIRLNSGTTTLADECAAEGKDWEQTLRQRIREEALEQELRQEAGLSPAPSTAPSQSGDATEPPEADDNSGDDTSTDEAEESEETASARA